MSVRHYVNPEPFDPAEVERLTPEQERFYTASQWQLMWWKFRRHRLAVIAAWFLLFNYGSIFISEWIAPYNLTPAIPTSSISRRRRCTCSTRAASSAPSSMASTSSSTSRT